jgi:hypothetical protein
LGRCQQALALTGPAKTSFAQARQLNPKCTEATLKLERLASRGPGHRLRGFWRRLLGR